VVVVVVVDIVVAVAAAAVVGAEVVDVTDSVSPPPQAAVRPRMIDVVRMPRMRRMQGAVFPPVDRGGHPSRR